MDHRVSPQDLPPAQLFAAPIAIRPDAVWCPRLPCQDAAICVDPARRGYREGRPAVQDAARVAARSLTGTDLSCSNDHSDLSRLKNSEAERDISDGPLA